MTTCTDETTSSISSQLSPLLPPDVVEPQSAPSNIHLRWIVLILNCILLVGNYYAYDLPSALAPTMRNHLRKDEEEFGYLLGLFYSVYSFPNIVLPFVSGHLIEVVGIKRVLIALSVCVCTGQALFSIGTSTRTVWVMIGGRMIFGIGGESISVVQSCISTQWFQNKELAFALGLNLAIPRVGSVLNAMLSPAIANKYPYDDVSNDNNLWSFNGVSMAVWVGFGMCCASLTSALILAFVVGCEPQRSSNNEELVSEVDISIAEEQFSVGKLFKDTFKSTKTMPLSFWLLCPIVMLVYGSIIPFNNIIVEFLQSKWLNGDMETAGRMMGIPDFVCAILVSPCGYLVDRVGRRATIIVVSCLSIGCIHLTLALSPASDSSSYLLMPVLPLIFLGIAYSFYGIAYWSAIACIFSGTNERLQSTESTLLSPSVSLSSSFLSASKSRGISSTTLPLLAASRSILLPPNSSPLIRHQPPHANGLNIIPYSDENPLFKTEYNSPRFTRKSSNQSTPILARRNQTIGSLSVAPTPSQTPLLSLQQLEEDSEPLLSNKSNQDLLGKLAVAYGISTSVMNLSLTGVPVFVASIRQHFKFTGVETFFAIETFVAAIFGLVLLYFDWKDYRFGQLEASHYK